MEKESLGGVFLRHLMMATAWGLTFLVVIFVAAFGMTQQIKEGIEFTAVTFDSLSMEQYPGHQACPLKMMQKHPSMPSVEE